MLRLQQRLFIQNVSWPLKLSDVNNETNRNTGQQTACSSHITAAQLTSLSFL